MAIPFQYHPITNFPVDPIIGTGWNSKTQFILPDESVADDAHSTITYVGISPYHDYNKYLVRHEWEKECWIRVDRNDRKKAIFVDEFILFTPPNFSYALIRTSGKIATEFLRRIKSKYGAFSYTLREIDLGKLKEHLHPQVLGGWFRDLDIADVSTAAIFGSNVSESYEWDKYSSNGTLSSLVIEFTHRGDKHSVNISLSGSITLYSNYDESYALELVEKFNDIAMKFQKTIETKHLKGLKKTV
jgi:hypothetical protein